MNNARVSRRDAAAAQVCVRYQGNGFSMSVDVQGNKTVCSVCCVCAGAPIMPIDIPIMPIILGAGFRLDLPLPSHSPPPSATRPSCPSFRGAAPACSRLPPLAAPPASTSNLDLPPANANLPPAHVPSLSADQRWSSPPPSYQSRPPPLPAPRPTKARRAAGTRSCCSQLCSFRCSSTPQSSSITELLLQTVAPPSEPRRATHRNRGGTVYPRCSSPPLPEETLAAVANVSLAAPGPSRSPVTLDLHSACPWITYLFYVPEQFPLNYRT